jgi:hypothetical protein
MRGWPANLLSSAVTGAVTARDAQGFVEGLDERDGGHRPRITFGWAEGDATDVDLEDYH